MNRGFAIFLIVLVGGGLFGWREYEMRLREKIHQNIIQQKVTREKEKKEQIDQLKQLEKAEKTKFKVQVRHDNRPETNTYPMILDATSSFDPDQGDRIRYNWKQVSGNQIRLRPNSSSGIVSFEGTPGEYTFELTVLDNYGASTTVTKTVKIEPEPNQAPIVDLEIRQGTGTN
ncbi:uncharacterized protein METZ01_LOCUS265815 [marine metagenome]|jgi:hypothetical protein|uniref:PKD domain-containing protein n=1 Tax=marine metagenome TaxID=408172 RepID=A0A382JQS4_9ZZZZ